MNEPNMNMKKQIETQDNLQDNLIVKISKFFTERFRFTVLLAIAVLISGFLSYFYFLPKNSFPSVQLPVVIIRGTYLVNDQRKVNKEVTTLIEKELSNLQGIDNINSLTTDNAFNIALVLEENVDVSEFKEKVQSKLSIMNIPKEVNYFITYFDFTKFENEFNILLNIYQDKEDTNLQELELKAQELARDLLKLEGVLDTRVLQPIQSRANPISGQIVQVKERLDAVTIKKDNTLETYNAIAIGVIKKSNIDDLSFSNKINEFVKNLKNDQKYQHNEIIVTADNSTYIKQDLSALEKGFLTALLIILLVISFIINIKASIILLIFALLVLLGTITSIFIYGLELNVVTLFSLILVLGIFIDDGIVIIEAVAKYRSKGLDRVETVVKAVKEVGIPKIAGSVTTILVFIPMLFITGVLGNFIRSIPTTIISTLLISLFCALTFVAAIGVYTINKSEVEKYQKTGIIGKFLFLVNRILNWQNPLIQIMANKLAQFTNWYLSKKLYLVLVLILNITIILISLLYTSQLKFEIFPSPSDANGISIRISDIQATDKFNLSKEKEILNKLSEKIENKFSKEIDLVAWNVKPSSITASVNLIPYTERNITAPSISEEIKKIILEIDSNLKADVRAIGPGGPQETEYKFQMQVFMDDTNDLTEVSNLIKDYLYNKLDYTNRENKKIKVADVVVENLDTISKTNLKRKANIKAKFTENEIVSTLDVTNIQNLVKKELKETIQAKFKVDTEDILGTDLGVESRNLESLQSAILAFIISLLGMYGYLVLQYNSFSLPLLIYSAIIFALPILVPTLVISNTPLSFFVIISLITLAGIVVNNTIIFVDYANNLIKKGYNLKQACSLTIQSRFRPILATSLTTILGLAPLLTDPFWKAIAISIMLGLMSSTFFVITFFAAYYYVFEKLRNKIKHFFRKPY